MSDWKAVLPVNRTHPELEGWDVDDWCLDDGTTYGLFSDEGDRATIHVMATHDEALAGARKGHGRAFLELLRPHFGTVRANGVGSPPLSKDETPLDRQPSFMFWRAMLREGLCDVVIVSGIGLEITRDMLSAPIVTRHWVIEPDPLDVPAPSP